MQTRNYNNINPLFWFAVNMPVNRIFNLFIFLLLFSEFCWLSVGRSVDLDFRFACFCCSSSLVCVMQYCVCFNYN